MGVADHLLTGQVPNRFPLFYKNDNNCMDNPTKLKLKGHLSTF